MRRALVFALVWVVGLIAWLLGQKPRYRTEPKRPAFMWIYPDTVDRTDRAWRKWAQDARFKVFRR